MNHTVEQLSHRMTQHLPVLVLTGAGISTGSGIPAYRNREGEWTHPRPVLAAQFKGQDSVRRRYWRRSMSGWPNFHAARPNSAHLSLTALQKAGIVSSIVTQNVDGLHQAAQNQQVIELHGGLNRVMCLQCGQRTDRNDLQQALRTMNPEFVDESFTPGADGDADVAESTLLDKQFSYKHCAACGGLLKPDVVFYGENVPAETNDAGRKALTSAASLLCIGTSLSVLSGFRYCREAVARQKPVFILNQGKTRADDLADLKVDRDCSDALTELVTLLCR